MKALVAQLPGLRRYAMALAGNAALADDLVQDSIEKALRQKDQLREIELLPRWLGRVSNRWTLAPTGDSSTSVTVTSTVEIGSRAIQKLAERVVCRFVARQSDSMLAGLVSRLENIRV